MGLPSDLKVKLLVEASRAATSMLPFLFAPGSVVPDETGKDPSFQKLLHCYDQLSSCVFVELEAEAMDASVFVDPAPGSPAGSGRIGPAPNPNAPVATAVGQLTGQAVLAALQSLPAGSLAGLIGKLAVTGTASPASGAPAVTPSLPTSGS